LDCSQSKCPSGVRLRKKMKGQRGGTGPLKGQPWACYLASLTLSLLASEEGRGYLDFRSRGKRNRVGGKIGGLDAHGLTLLKGPKLRGTGPVADEKGEKIKKLRHLKRMTVCVTFGTRMLKRRDRADRTRQGKQTIQQSGSQQKRGRRRLYEGEINIGKRRR